MTMFAVTILTQVASACIESEDQVWDWDQAITKCCEAHSRPDLVKGAHSLLATAADHCWSRAYCGKPSDVDFATYILHGE